MAIISKTYFSKLAGINRIDSEYFSPEYLKLENTLENLDTIPITSLSNVSDGNHMSISKYFTNQENGIPYFRGQDINDFFLENAEPFKITEIAFNKGWMKRSHFKTGDVLLSIVGTVGSLSYVSERIKESTGSCKIAILRPKANIDGRFLSVFLKSRYGQFQIKRNVRGAVQTGLILKDMVFIKVPDIPFEEQKRIGELVQLAINKNFQSKSLYHQAETLLNETLGINQVEFKKDKTYRSSFNEVVNSNRIDGDFYQTKYKQLAGYLEKIETRKLSSIAKFQKGYEVGSANYTDSGPLFIRVSNLTTEGFSQGNSDKYVSAETYKKYKIHQPEIGDVLLTKDGTIGTCYVVDEDLEGIISSGIIKLYNIDPEIHKEYLALVINSVSCSMQANRDCSGALILHWKPGDIRKMKIPILPKKIRNHLAELVVRSKEARKESKRLLAQAIHEVETLIEQAAKN